MNLAPFARIALRYGVGYMLGSEIGNQLAADQDLVMALSLGMAALVEGAYVYAKKTGGKT
jgi:hypothetical protein